jgi:DNA-binding NarL/FixJ family response regulator
MGSTNPPLSSNAEITRLRGLVDTLQEQVARQEAVIQKVSASENSVAERLKGLNCLYGIAHIFDRLGDNEDKILQTIADLLPGAWRYPGSARASISIRGKTYTSPGFARSALSQEAPIFFQGHILGTVGIFYVGKGFPPDEPIFLPEEQTLIDAVGVRIGKFLERRQLANQLAVEREALRESNAALKVLLKRIEKQREETRRDLAANLDKIVMPALLEIERRVPKTLSGYMEILRQNLEELVSPFTSGLARRHNKLTQTELQICKLIRNGMSSKDIAELKQISAKTVNKQRENIRRKLALTNTQANLRTYLENFEERA